MADPRVLFEWSGCCRIVDDGGALWIYDGGAPARLSGDSTPVAAIRALLAALEAARAEAETWRRSDELHAARVAELEGEVARVTAIALDVIEPASPMSVDLDGLLEPSDG